MGRESVLKGAHARGGLTNGQLSRARGTRSYTVTTSPGVSEAQDSPPLERLTEGGISRMRMLPRSHVHSKPIFSMR